ncbi:MaoC family dehydratase N-terminal domain-containing protein [Spongisporangium articulatum]|uniref:MaoC family dehydratase N-terminal domain-containing protein n=1 Tax=Spongisporangium articulatum TaxID=3362603 RepID=A0ABW8ATL2_9ACTN
MDIKGAAAVAAPELVPDAARATVGTVVSRRSGPVIAREFQRWAAAVGDRNPLYFDAEFAGRHGYRDIVAPPLFLPVAVLGVVDVEQLRPDGVPAGFLGTVPLPHTPRLMAGGESWEFGEPAHPGDQVTAVRRIRSVEQKAGRSGAFVVVVAETVYTRGDGALLARATDTVLALP